ncbi:MAG: response regulator transcription factor [Anaerolineae bacterium]|nr:response regulator transcription factor [Anaerolineae bacterium]MDW8172291.1 response regulator transcription factor [Anaerolineae bacterium]
MSTMHVWVLADDPLTRVGLSALLSEQGVEVAGQSAAQGHLLHAIEATSPDALVLDWGYEASQAPLALLDESDVPPIVLLSSSSQAAQIISLLSQDDDEAEAPRAYGLLPRQSPIDKVLAALRAVLSGLLAIDPSLRAALQNPASPRLEAQEAPTPRELEVLRLLAEGLPNKLIARKLGITDHTVKYHVNAIMGKLGAQSRTDAVVRAARAGWLKL